MHISSMTGFARNDGQTGLYCWVWEMRSVNSKGLDLRFRVPSGYEALEAKARDRVSKYIKRGSVAVSLQVQRSEGQSRLSINEDALAQILSVQKRLGDRVDTAPPRIETLLSVRGIAEMIEDEESDQEREDREAAMLSDFDTALSDLVDARRSEGVKIAAVLQEHLSRISDQATQARDTAALQPERLRERLMEQVATLLDAQTPLSEDRLAQEVALLVSKADVREEVDRLDAHIAAASSLLDGGGDVGRKLDFLCQEFNREANTVCSKSPDIALTDIGLALKAAIEQFREQVQNIE